MSIEDEKTYRWNRPLKVIPVAWMYSIDGEWLHAAEGPWSSTSNLPCDILTARTWKKRLQRRRKTSNWTALQPGSNHWFHLVTAQICKVELNYVLTASPLFWLVYTKSCECNHRVHLLRYQIRLASSSILSAPACTGSQKWFMIDPYKLLKISLLFGAA